MPKVLKILTVLVVISSLVWLATLWRWQSNQRDPELAEIVLHLAVLPLLLTAALVTSLSAVKSLRLYATAPTPLVTSPESLQATSATDSTAADDRSASFAVLDAHLQVRAGATWSGAMASLASGECKPELDCDLRDEEGLAIFTARMPDVSTDAAADALEQLVTQLRETNADTWSAHQTATDVLRATALLDTVIATAQESFEMRLSALKADSHPAQPNALATTSPPQVTIRVGIPARWSPRVQELANRWLAQRFEPLIELGPQIAGQSRATTRQFQLAVQLHVHPVDSAEAFWLLLDQQLQQWQRGGAAGLLWALTADSLISDAEIARMHAAQTLFTGRNQRGLVPGEAAASMLLASHAWRQVDAAEPVLARLHRASLRRRDKSADATGRIGSETLRETTTDALQAADIAPGALKHLLADTDHRATRTAEVYQVVQELLPHLEASTDILRLGVGCGDLGVARLLVCAALAATQVHDKQEPALLLGSQPPNDRFAVVLAPIAPSESAGPLPQAG